MKYKTILWDIDGTLLNFEMSERISMEKCLEKHGVSMTEAQFEEYKKINKECWKMIEKEESVKMVEVYSILISSLLNSPSADEFNCSSDYAKISFSKVEEGKVKIGRAHV